jgi:cytochrome c5
LDALTASVIKGKGAMPPKGGSAASDAEIKSAVAYMLGAVK